MKQRGIVMITSGFPRRSETFVLNELLALEAQGLLTAIFATKPGDASNQPGSEKLLRRVCFLPAGTPDEQASALIDKLVRDDLIADVAGVHGYFAHVPAEIAALTARRLGVPYGFSMHALDARKVAPAELVGRARAAAGVIACNVDVARELPPDDVNLHLVPHGVDLCRFHPDGRPANDVGHAEHEPLCILSVGRLVPKKGFDVLIEAVALLSFPVEVRIVGDGPERERLTALIAAHGLADRVRLCPGMTHAELPEAYAAADVIVVPSVVDMTGDRDGLPNVVLEAMASARPVVASDAGAISSAVRSGDTGLLVPQSDSGALASALTRLAAEPELRRRLGERGRRCVERKFALDHCTDRLGDIIRQMYVC